MTIRVPVIPDHNDSEANIRATASFAQLLGLSMIHLLPYHRLGAAKYHRLQLAYRLEDLCVPDAERMQALSEIVQSYGLDVQIGG
jgi:pyruvate formate lyase activating enzyme